MPLIAHNALPSFQRLREEGQAVLHPTRSARQDIRGLHVGLLNMMPDAALEATERQFFRLVGASNPIAQFYVHPFTLPELPRGETARAHIARYYEDFDQLSEQGLDALIITGANATSNELSEQAFWDPLKRVMAWAEDRVTSTLCSCLATHAVMEFRYGHKRVRQGDKRWGVFSHQVVDQHHPLVHDVNTRFDVPHSRFNDVGKARFKAAGLRVLVESREVGVHLATSPDGLRFVFFQGHPEYDTISLLKEYKREMLRYAREERSDDPPFPDHYLDSRNQALANEYRLRLEEARAGGDPWPEFPEDLMARSLHNTWHDTAKAVIGNWIGLVYQVTHSDRLVPFMEHVDPDDPLKLGD